MAICCFLEKRRKVEKSSLIVGAAELVEQDCCDVIVRSRSHLCRHCERPLFIMALRVYDQNNSDPQQIKAELLLYSNHWNQKHRERFSSERAVLVSYIQGRKDHA